MNKLLVLIIVIVATGIGAVFFFQKLSFRQVITLPKQSSQQNTAPNTTYPVSVSTNAKSLFGTMIAFPNNEIPSISDVIAQKGWTEFRKDTSAYKNLLNNLKKLIQDRVKLVKETGFSIDREVVPYFTWNVIEPQKGRFAWELTDIYVKWASDAGVKISAVIQPFASWDQKTSPLANCNALDFAYYDYKAGPPNDLAEYENFLKKTVERYKNKIAVWEIGNEVEGDCGGYKNNPQGYTMLLKISSETIKKADPQAIVLNGGALEFSDVRGFWKQFFALGGDQYTDYFNLHYNRGRSPNAQLDSAILQEDLMFFNNLMEENGSKKPLYLTEFGIYSGSPPVQPLGQPIQWIGQPIQPNQEQAPRDVSENKQAALYFKDSILAFANGVEMIFIDLVGPDNGVVGSSAAFNIDGQSRLFLTTLKTIASKISSFSKVKKIADGQYKFAVSNKTIYALWSGTLPEEISGRVKVTDMQGQEQITDTAEIKLKIDQPIFIELQK